MNILGIFGKMTTVVFFFFHMEVRFLTLVEFKKISVESFNAEREETNA